MRLALGFGKRIWVIESKITTILLQNKGDEDDDEDFEHVPQDPHSTVMSHMEISPEAIGMGGYRRFGFHGSKG